MRKVLIAAGLIAAACWVLPSRAWTNGGELDTSAVTSVIIKGQASMIHLSTDGGEPYRASIDSRRKGWFAFWYSSWSGNGCDISGAMRVVGPELTIDTAAAAWSWFEDGECRFDIKANLREGAAVAIDQSATLSRLDGDFSAVRVASRAGDIALNGHARDLQIEGEAMRVHLVYAKVNHDEDIRIDGNALDAEVTFPEGTSVNYSVTGAASFVDAGLPNTPGAKPLLTIKGSFLRAKIR